MSASSGPAYAAPRQQVDEARTFDATIVAQGYVHNALGARVCGSGTLIDLSDMDMAHAPRPQVGHTYHFENAWIFEGNPGQLFFLISNSPRFRYWEILGCPSSPAPAAPQIVVNFSVDQANLMFGQCTNLRWDVDNVRAVYLDGQGVVGHDSRQICPSSTTTYNLRVQTNGGEINRSVTVNVQVPPPQIVFSADRTSILLGDCTILRWALAYVQGMSLDGSAISNPGTRQVCPSATTTYTLNAFAPSGTVSRSVTVVVVPPTLTPTSTPTQTPTSTPASTPTWTSTPGSLSTSSDLNLVATALELDPDPPTAFTRIHFRVIVQNQGDIPNPAIWIWDYTGQVEISSPGKGTIEKHQVSGTATGIDPIHGPDGLAVYYNRWQATFRIDLGNVPLDSDFQVVLRTPINGSVPILISRAARVKPNTTELSKCTAFVLRQIAMVLPPASKESSDYYRDAKALTDGIVAGGSVAACDDFGCIAKAIVKLIFKYASDPTKVIAMASGVGDTEGAAECAFRVNLFWELMNASKSETQVAATADTAPTVSPLSATPTATVALLSPTVPPPPPGVYVTKIRIEPPNPNSAEDIRFFVSFWNTAGPLQFKWCVYIYDPGAPRSRGQTACNSLVDFPLGTYEYATPNTWKLGPGTPCTDLTARVEGIETNGNHLVFKTPDSGDNSFSFRVCP